MLFIMSFKIKEAYRPESQNLQKNVIPKVVGNLNQDSYYKVQSKESTNQPINRSTHPPINSTWLPLNGRILMIP